MSLETAGPLALLSSECSGRSYDVFEITCTPAVTVSTDSEGRSLLFGRIWNAFTETDTLSFNFPYTPPAMFLVTVSKENGLWFGDDDGDVVFLHSDNKQESGYSCTSRGCIPDLSIVAIPGRVDASNTNLLTIHLL